MIFLTGDVHDMSMGRDDQEWLNRHSSLTEIECALKYAELARKYNLRVTLFLSGNLVENEPASFQALASMGNVDIGGHTYNAFLPSWRHLLFDFLFRSYYGPRFYQKKDIRKTIALLNRHLEKPVKVWRTHGYRSDKTTMSLLPEFGIEVVSDHVSAEGAIRKIAENLYSLPINTPPDHEHLSHGELNQAEIEWEHLLIKSVFNIAKVPVNPRTLKRLAKEVVKRCLNVRTPRQPFGDTLHAFPDWWIWEKEYISRGIGEKGFATLLLHPVCWEILDGMASLETVFKELSEYQSHFVRDVPEISPRLSLRSTN